MTPFGALVARAVVLPADDVDTDQIIPARFLTVTSKAGLAAHLFADWRARPDFPLSAEGAAGAQILIAGANFGCGSSREHAPWALVDWGFRAIIARSFADIFRDNALKNGLLPIALPDDACAQLERVLAAEPRRTLRVDVAAQQVMLDGDGWRAFDGTAPAAPPNDGRGSPTVEGARGPFAFEGPFSFEIDAFAKHCLVTGLDELGYILALEAHIAAHEARVP